MSGSPFRFRPDIEGLRAIAVLLVLLFHAGVPFLPGGYVGVDVFFVVSGFLITGILVRETANTGRLSISNFYARRIRRILPMSSVVLIAILIASVFIMPSTQLDTIKTSVVAAALFVANWVFAAQSVDYFAANVVTNPVLHFWSLSVEEQFYFIWPLLIVLVMFLVRRNSKLASHRTAMLAGALGVISLISFVLSVTTSSATGGIAYYGLQTRLWELGLGGLLAIAAHKLTEVPGAIRIVAGWLGLAMIMFAGFTFTKATVFPGAAALIPVLGTALVLAAGIAKDEPKAAAGRLLAVKPMQYIGARSYNLYLWHWPVLVFAGALTTERVTDAVANIDAGGIAPPLPATIAVGIAFLLTIVTYRWIEQPLRHHDLMHNARTALPIGAAMIATVVAAALLLTPLLSKAYTAMRGGNQEVLQNIQQLDKPQDLAEEQFLERQKVCRGDQNQSAQESIDAWFANNCVFGDPNGTKTLALVGDSHADVWLWALDQAGKDHSWKIISLARTNCPYMALGTTSTSDIDITNSCTEYANMAFNQILSKNQPLDAIMLARTSNTLNRYVSPRASEATKATQVANLEQATTRSLDKFGTLSKEVLITEDPPRAEFDIPACLERNNGDPKKCSFNRAAGLVQERELQAIEKQAAAQITGDFEVRFLPIGDVHCPPSQTKCEVITAGGNITYRDSNHITFKAAHEYSEQIAQLIIEYGRLQ